MIFTVDGTFQPVVQISGLTIRDGLVGIENYGELTVTDAVLSCHVNPALPGGAIRNFGSLTLHRSTVSDSLAQAGGGLYNADGGTAIIQDTTFSGNHAESDGGAILNLGETKTTNTTISGNSANRSGGGIYTDSDRTVLLTNVTLTNNRADADGDFIGRGGGVSVVDFLAMHNTIVADNYRGAGTTGDEIEGAASADSSHNLVGTLSTFLDAGGLSPSNGNLYIGGDIHLGPLADNGGPTRTHALLASSPALDAGSNAKATDVNLLTDQRGEARFRNGGSGAELVDIGAYEAVELPMVFVVTTAADEDDGGLGLGQGDSLREVLNAANENPGADQVFFSLPPQTVVTITDGLPAITDELTLSGPGINELIVQSTTAFQTVANYSALDVSGLRFEGIRFANQGGELVITDSVISENKCGLIVPGLGCLLSLFPQPVPVSEISGGGIFNDGTLILRRSTVSNNQAVGGFDIGGGIYNTSNGTATIIDSTISDNKSTLDGGGIANAGVLTILNSTISGNRASRNGGGIHNGAFGTVMSVNVTIAYNEGDVFGAGGGISGAAGVTLLNSIVAENIGGQIEGMVEEDSSYNLLGVDGTDPSETAGLSSSKGNIFVDFGARLGPLADNGGPTRTHALLTGSPAIDRGSNASAAAANLTVDQRGEERFRDGGSGAVQIDIGAYEAPYMPSIFVVTTTADEDNGGLGLGQGDSLREVIEAANQNAPADTIEFALPAQSIITLTRLLPWVEGDLTIAGPGASELTVQSDGVSRSLTNQAALDLSGVTLRGVRVFNSNSGTLTVSGSVITDNYLSSSNGGGGIYNRGTLTLLRSTVSNNQVSGSGGGIFNDAGASATILDSTISGNETASDGGGIANRGELTILNSTISGNHADGQGGAIHDTSNDPVLLANVTIAENSVAVNLQDAGGIFTSSGNLTLHNTVVARNFSNSADSNLVGLVNPISSFNLIGPGSFSDLPADSGNRLDVDDPGIAPLADNGGPTATHALLGRSPAPGRRGQSLATSPGAAIRSAWRTPRAGWMERHAPG